VPGDPSAATFTGLIADEMAGAMVNGKATAVRVIPIPGRRPGKKHECGGLLGTAIAKDPGKFSCEVLWRRGGRIPAPMQSYRY